MRVLEWQDPGADFDTQLVVQAEELFSFGGFCDFSHIRNNILGRKAAAMTNCVLMR